MIVVNNTSLIFILDTTFCTSSHTIRASCAPHLVLGHHTYVCVDVVPYSSLGLSVKLKLLELGAYIVAWRHNRPASGGVWA